MCADWSRTRGSASAVGCAMAGTMSRRGGVWVDEAVEEGGLAGGSDCGGCVAAAGGEWHCECEMYLVLNVCRGWKNYG